MAKVTRVPLQSMFNAMARNCGNCVNRLVRKETIRYYHTDSDGRPLPSFSERIFTTERCTKDLVAHGIPHPFGQNWRGPVLTCKEMRLNACGKEARFFDSRIAQEKK